jgi:two-component system chemotaxis response regulator CheB
MGAMEERPLRILAADDSAVMRGVMWKLFQMHAEDRSSELPRMELCGVALDGVDCLESVKRLSPDVLVLDLEMPRLNGLEVLRRLQVENPGLPVIMCSYVQCAYRAGSEVDAGGTGVWCCRLCDQAGGAARLRLRDDFAVAAAVAADCCAGQRRETEAGECYHTGCVGQCRQSSGWCDAVEGGHSD